MKINNTISVLELKAGISLSLVIFLRMLALFMLLPVIALMANEFDSATSIKIGIALGIYGLTQALFQIPLGMLSDKWGRKPIIALGLMVFVLGSVIAGLAESIDQLIIGRALQGAGAIAATIMAMAADLSREEQRTKVMAIIGISIGVAFSLAFILGPLVYHEIGYRGLFFLCAIMAGLAIFILFSVVPNPQHIRRHRDIELITENFKQVIHNSTLIRLNISIFITHLVLMANFTVVPLILRDHTRLETDLHWQFYLPVIVVSLIFAAPLLIFAERLGKNRSFLMLAIVLFLVSQSGIAIYYQTYFLFLLFMTLFFIGFNYLEAYLPAQVSRSAPVTGKGTALGIYSTSQFIGIFAGGVLGGVLHALSGITAVYTVCAMLAVLWLVLILTLPQLEQHTSVMLNVGNLNAEHANKLVSKLSSVTGVVDAVVIAEEGIAYLKVNNEILDVDALNTFSSCE